MSTAQTLEREATIEERLRRIEGMLGLKPDLRFVAGSEFWIVQAEGSRGSRALAYWGPYADADQAGASGCFRPQLGCVLIEVPT